MSRLTYINHKKGSIFDCERELPAFAKLGQLEDVLEKYNLDNANDLDIEIRSNRDKVYKYEGIEKEYGIDLIEILTAKEVYTFGTDVIAPHKLGKTNKIIKCNMFLFDFINKTIHIHVPGVGLYSEPFSDYGKTWALNRKELENA